MSHVIVTKCNKGIFTKTSHSTIVGLFRVYLSNLISMLLLVKVMVLEWILVMVSNIVFFTV